MMQVEVSTKAKLSRSRTKSFGGDQKRLHVNHKKIKKIPKTCSYLLVLKNYHICQFNSRPHLEFKGIYPTKVFCSSCILLLMVKKAFLVL